GGDRCVELRGRDEAPADQELEGGGRADVRSRHRKDPAPEDAGPGDPGTGGRQEEVGIRGSRLRLPTVTFWQSGEWAQVLTGTGGSSGRLTPPHIHARWRAGRV